MFTDIQYNRIKAVEYAEKWAFSRNSRFGNFDDMGGDCTNFASQCIYAGCGVMNYTKNIGWYFNSMHDRSAAWSGVEFLYKFLKNNTSKENSPGPYAEETNIAQIQLGDIIQLGDNTGHFYHSLVVTGKNSGNDIDSVFVTTHTYDSYMRPLNSYVISQYRCLHITGCRKYS